MIDRTIGPYRILDKLGAGGMGEVYRARDLKLNRDVAIKILPDAFAHDAERVGRLMREAQALAALNHPNIAQIYGVIEAPSTSADPHGAGHVHALVMEAVDGEDLSAILARGPLPVAEALPVAKQLIDALEAAHEQGIVHRDLKPANIKVRSDGTVKVLDFGLAKALASNGTRTESGPGGSSMPTTPRVAMPGDLAAVDGGQATRDGAILGTAAYMAPEQARGRPVDRRADIWAFGVVLYEMLTGRRAFAGGGLFEVLASVLKSDPDWSVLPPATPPSVRRLLRRCLEREPRKRLSAIGDARFDREDAPEIAVAAKPGVRERRGWLPLVAAMTGAVVLTTLVMKMMLRPDAAEVLTRLSIVAPPDTSLVPDNREMALSPDGRAVAFVTGRPIVGSSQLWVRAFDSLDARRIEGADGAHLPFWSPDSRRIGFFANGKLNTVPIEGGRVKPLCDAPDGRGGTWGANDVIVFAPASAGGLLRVSAEGGEPSAATVLDLGRKEAGHRFPVFLPDGRHFLFAVMPAVNGVAAIFVGVLDSTERSKLLEAQSAPVYTDPGYLVFSRKGTLVAQPFDAKRLRVSGEPLVLDDAVSDVGNTYTLGAAASATSKILVYRRDPLLNTRLVWTNRDGLELGGVEAPTARYTEIHLDPDGRRVAVVRVSSAQTAAVWVLDLVRHGLTRLTDSAGLSYAAVWSPDGRQLVYTGWEGGTETLFTRDATAAAPAQTFFASPALFKQAQSWSPDGRFVLYTRHSASNGDDLVTLSATGRRSESPYLSESFDENAGRFSPNGRWVAYVSDEAGSNDVYVRSFPVPDRKYRVTTDGGTWVAWKRDNTALLVVGADGRELKAAVVREGQELSIGVPKVVGHLPEGVIAWDAAGDLERLLVSVPTSGNGGSVLTVVSNWTSALRKR